MENFCQALGNVVQHTANAMQGLRFPLLSPSFCFGLQEQARGGSTFRRKPCSQGLHAVLLNLPGTVPRLGKKKKCFRKKQNVCQPLGSPL